MNNQLFSSGFVLRLPLAILEERTAGPGEVLIVSRRCTMSPGTGVVSGTSRRGRRLRVICVTILTTWEIQQLMLIG